MTFLRERKAVFRFLTSLSPRSAPLTSTPQDRDATTLTLTGKKCRKTPHHSKYKWTFPNAYLRTAGVNIYLPYTPKTASYLYATPFTDPKWCGITSCISNDRRLWVRMCMCILHAQARTCGFRRSPRDLAMGLFHIKTLKLNTWFYLTAIPPNWAWFI